MTQQSPRIEPFYLRHGKSLYRGFTALTLGWVVILRDYFLYKHWHRAAAICDNVPNFLTVSRGLAALPVTGFFFWEMYFQQSTAEILFFVILSLFLLDAVDGPLADMLNHKTTFGAEADPFTDKLLAFPLLLVFPLLVGHLQNPILGWAALLMSLPLYFLEVRVATYGILSRKYSRLADESVKGAYGAGKTKFNLEALGLTMIYSTLLWAPELTGWTLAGVGVLVIASGFARASLVHHRAEFHDLKNLSKTKG